jgi:magnesium-transporting ATPase (P-type)
LDTKTEASVASGLTSEIAAERLIQFGPNDPLPRKRCSAVADFLRLFSNPLVLVLLIAAAASAALRRADVCGR